jgi:predicted acyl esterase
MWQHVPKQPSWLGNAGSVVPEQAPQPRTLRAWVLDALTARVLKMPPGQSSYAISRAVRVPMRDGVDLLADVYHPRHSLGTVLIRTPYGRSGPITVATARFYASHAYQVVNQSCRGTSGSGGVFQPFSQELDDGADTVAWLRQQEWFGGRFAAVGASYLGWAVWALLMDPPPELSTAVIAIAAHDNYRVAHGTGAFSLETTLGLFDGFARLLERGEGLAGYLSAVTAGRRLKRGVNELPLVRAHANPSAFTYDPADPTLGIGGQLINPARGGYRDNRRLEGRADILIFTTQLLSEPLEVIGIPVVELVHGTDNPHADLFVRICQVEQTGRSINVSDGFQRLRPQEANGTVRLELEAMAHRFTPGTRIRLQVSGGSHPRYARNLGTDKDPATSTELAPSRRTIFHGDGGFSRILLPCPIGGH